MKTTFKKAISVLLVAVMMLSIAPLAGFVGLDLPEINLFGTKAEAATEEYYTYSVYNGEATITGFDESISKDITIPSTLGGYPVTKIGSGAFLNCTNLESVTIPDSVTDIGYGSFTNCTNLKSVTINNGVMDSFAFQNCTGLENVTIGNGVTSIGLFAFQFCTNLTNIYYTGEIADWCRINFGMMDSNPMFYADNFYLNGELLEGNVVVSEELTSINSFAFSGYKRITSITVDPNNSAYSSDKNGVLFNKDKTVLIQYPIGNTRESYTIPESVTNIDDFAFYYCTNLKSLVIGKSVTTIGLYAFGYCSKLSSITIPKSLEGVGISSFGGCNKIKDIYYAGSKNDWEEFTIGTNNGTLATAKVHYNYKYDNSGSTDVPDNIPDYDSSVKDSYLVPTPTETKISYGDSIVLHVDPSKIPEGGYVEWYPSNGNFSYSVSSDGTTCTITPDKKGDTTFTAIVYDADSNIVSADEQTMTSKAGFFDKIIAFFKRLFGLTKTIPEAVKVIC